MDILTADMECFYDSEYTLSKLNTEAYLRDPRMEEILWGIKWNDSPAFWLLPDRAAHFFKNEVNWADTALVCHHSHFDGARLNWAHDCRPALHVDTLSMARALDGPKAGNSLHDLCTRHGVGEKGDYVTYAKGKHLADFTTGELYQYGQYCCNDCDRTYDLAQIFIPQLPMEELKVIDILIRMFTEPVFVGDAGKLKGAVASERQHKIDLLRRVNLLCPHCGGTGINRMPDLSGAAVPCVKCDGQGTDKKTIGSNEKLAAMFRELNIEPETKTSPTTGKQILAFAKTDPAMQALLEDEDEEVRNLAEARIGIKSNIIETRAERFQRCAERGPMPVYISPFAAHTFRAGGGDSMNWQNISGHNAKRPEMAVIKASVGAPLGYKCVRVDSSQGEARINAWNAGQEDLVEAFRQGRDVYSEHAGTIFGRVVDRRGNPDDFIPGQIGKVSILGMGYGMGYLKAAAELLKGMLGAPPIQFTERDMLMLHVDPSRMLNNPAKTNRIAEMPSRLELNDRLIHCAVTEALVQRYRQRYAKIKAYWDFMETVINAMIQGEEVVFGANGCMRTGHEFILMPNGLKLQYKGIQRDGGQASYFNGRERVNIHGALLTENTTQCLHYIMVGGQMIEVAEVLKVGIMTHDDIITVVPDADAELARDFMVQTMSKVPSWAAGLPLAGEGKIGQTLLEVK
jgi:DNA polymerase